MKCWLGRAAVPVWKTVDLTVGAKLIFEVISRVYEHHGLMLTTNLAFEEWTEIFG
jgi:DNA replication protein DnaC